ncbi:TIGR01777 family oxidoreductase [Neochlamydia sp. S13]|uniref:TIGR01777 family oxidoreductase n=1 Tax=Neochlamydia sp. S13 TaxID=1353976 RepID=UPI0005A9B787|nr:TIGR01777 family oxidoreductase [Neochlamydia sp. S13]BBI17218.1 Epimerase family protein Mb2239 [Neochlamydia sp. S13]
MKILVAGASGFIGKSLVIALMQAGHYVKILVRKNTGLAKNEISWAPEKGAISDNDLEGIEGIINLAGDNIFKGRWTEAKKRSIIESRLQATRTLASCLFRLKNPPKLFINASAIGYYGNRGDLLLTEESSNGTGFLAHVCEEWEKATHALETMDVRVACLRFGIVLSTKGGALAKMLVGFKWGIGGRIGSGQQYMSWVILEDVLAVILHVLKAEKLKGPINVVAPHPVTNDVFTKTLGKALGRPTILSFPSFVLRVVLGEKAEELLLSSQRVSCSKLIDSGYTFLHSNLEKALPQLLAQES